MAVAFFSAALFLRFWMFLAISSIIVTTQYLPDSQSQITDELERLLVDTGGINDSIFKSGITPCSNYVDGSTGRNNNTLGRQTAAAWIRTAFHDFANPNITVGDGGLDASIGFETLRPENIGVAMNDSLTFFSFFFNARASMADLIALGTVMAIGACGGPQVPLRGGRIDATEAGPYTVCLPETDINTTLSRFSASGFKQQDAIALVACGHSMGGVHHESFPDVVPEKAVGVNNLAGLQTFNEAPATFNRNSVIEYLTNTGEGGGPLVTTSNATVRSDLHMYLSDGNKTAENLSRSADEFASTCSSLIARMIDTVPKGVKLTPVIKPQHVRLINITLDVNWDGEMTLGGYVRYLQDSGDDPAPDCVEISLIERSGETSKIQARADSSPTEDVGTSIFGPTRFYPFKIRFPAAIGVSGVKVLNQDFPLQDSLFVVFGLSSNPRNISTVTPKAFRGASEYTFNLTAAFLTSSPPNTLTATIAIPVPQDGNLSPRMDFSKQATMPLIGKAGPFSLYSVITKLNVTGKQLFGTTVDIEADGSEAKATFFKLWSLFQKP